MGDMIARLKLESGEFDSKVKRATQGLLAMEQECRSVGGTLAILDKEQVDYIKSLGKMDTVSKNVRGQLGELKSAYTDLAVMYKRLTDEEKNGDFGKNIISSLQDLKTRIKETEGNLKDVTGEISGSGGLTGALDSLAGKFGLSVEQLTKFGGVAGIAAGALKVAKDAFLQSEPNIDSWEGTVKGAETAYNQLLTQLNQGSWANFFKNITDAYNAGVALYGVLDKMGSVKANNEFAISQNEAALAGLRAQLRKAQNEGDTAAADSIKKQMAAVEETIKSLKGEIEKATYDAGRSTVETILNSSYKATTGRAMNMASIDAIIEDLGKRGQVVFTEAEKTYKELRKKGTYTNYTTVGSSITGYAMSGSGESFDLNRLTPEEQRLYARALAIMNNEANLQPALALLSDSARQRQAASNQEYQVTRWIGSGGGSGGGSGSSKEQTKLQEVQAEIAKLTSEAMEADKMRLEVIRAEIAALKEQAAQYKAIAAYASGNYYSKGAKVEDPSTWSAAGSSASTSSGIVDEFTKINIAGKLSPIVDVGKKTKESWKDAAKAVASVGSALEGLEDPSAKIAGIVGQAVANIALGFAQATASDSKLGIFGWIAAIAGGLGTMISTIAAIKSATKGYAEGGIIQGTSYSGDNIRANGGEIGLNAGELILNKSQQANVAHHLLSNEQRGWGGGTPYVTGEKIVLGINNWGKKNGKGELVFSRT